MSIAKILISLPSDLKTRFQTAVPARQRSNVIRELLEKEVQRREDSLYQCAKAIEADDQLNKEMKDWESTIGDGIDEDEADNNKTW